MKVLLVAVALSGLASAQFLSGLSPCAASCTESTIKSLTTCDVNDTTCLCTTENREAVEAGTPACLGNCTIADQQAVQDLYTNTCGDIPATGTASACPAVPTETQTFASPEFGFAPCIVDCLFEVIPIGSKCADNDFCCQCTAPAIFDLSDLLQLCVTQNCSSIPGAADTVQPGLFKMCEAGGITLPGDPNASATPAPTNVLLDNGVTSTATSTSTETITSCTKCHKTDIEATSTATSTSTETITSCTKCSHNTNNEATSTATSTSTETITSCTKCATHAPFSNSTSGGAGSSSGSESGSGSSSSNGNGNGHINGALNGANAGPGGSSAPSSPSAKPTFATTNSASMVSASVLGAVLGTAFLGFALMA